MSKAGQPVQPVDVPSPDIFAKLIHVSESMVVRTLCDELVAEIPEL